MKTRDALGYLATFAGLILLLAAGLVNHEATPVFLGSSMRFLFTPAAIFGGIACTIVGYRLLLAHGPDEVADP
ncbi:MAG: hypothetical protein ABIP39_11130 [Polyangiaceae bacterium]